MALDNPILDETLLEIWTDTCRFSSNFDDVRKFAQAIYALGVAEGEKRKHRAFGESIAEAIRKG